MDDDDDDDDDGDMDVVEHNLLIKSKNIGINRDVSKTKIAK